MGKRSLFIAIEGLDGSGKTSVARHLANVLEYAHKGSSVKLTFEPHDPSCAGLFIRQVLMKKIRNFTPRILPLAFAANRLDHCDREINPWLEGGDNRIVLCDRYYLSSLVYQSSEDFPYAAVLQMNEKARKPDIIFFINVSDKVCYERMRLRNQPDELFEKNLSESRQKYLEAIAFLKAQHNDTIVEIDGSGRIVEVVKAILEEIYTLQPEWKQEHAAIPFEQLAPKAFDYNGSTDYSIEAFLDDFFDSTTPDEALINSETDLINALEQQISALSFEQSGALFLDYVKKLGYAIGKKRSGTNLDCYELEYTIPGNILQSGTALLINEPQRYDVIMQSIPQLYTLSDFMLVFSPGPSDLVNQYFERDKIQYEAKNNAVAVALAPNIQIVTQKNLAEFIALKVHHQSFV